MFGIKKKCEVGILINPAAAKNRDGAGATAGRCEAIAKGISPAVWIASSVDDIYRIAEEFRSRGLKYLLVSGGNGTFHHVVSRFKTVYRGGEIPPVLLLKAGHINTIAESIGLQGDGPDILERFTALARKGRRPLIMKRDLIKIEDRYCVIFGCGIITTFMDLYYQMGEYTPHKAFEVLTRMISSLRKPSSKEAKKFFAPFNAKISINGAHWKRRNILGCLGLTIPSVGLGFNPGSRALDEAGNFQLICTALKPVDFLTQVFRIYAGVRIEDPNHFDDLVKEILIESRDLFRYTMDGEMYDAIYELRVSTSSTGVNLIYV
jgi:diacylglycerol kinase family enzyme